MWELLKRAAVPLRVGAGLALLYIAYVFVDRYMTSRQWEARQKAAAEKVNPVFVETYGGSALKILQFYAREGVVNAGQSTVICYGVLNARSVKIDPPMSGVIPSISNCLEIQPRHDTKYTLTAEGKDGKTAEESFTVRVLRAAPDQ